MFLAIFSLTILGKHDYDSRIESYASTSVRAGPGSRDDGLHNGVIVFFGNQQTHVGCRIEKWITV